MNDKTTSEFYYQIISLLISIIVVHLFYMAIVRPEAEEILMNQRKNQEQGIYIPQETSFYITVKDFEQETCFVLMFWSIAIIGFKAKQTNNQRSILSFKLIDSPEETNIIKEDTNKYIRIIQSAPEETRDYLLPRALLSSLQRYSSTGNIQEASQAINECCENEAERLNSELSMIRYITWAIPSIGFIGTVRGISLALGQAHEAVQGDILGVTMSLGVAFNSTFVALIISLLVMFLMHQLQLMQERLVLDTHAYCENNFIRKLES